mmetsp:Transcript_810/g.1667  ORF Transcript_810/g.1667 Transcript_810/m.1667 type:complete len:121 (-) Transcript_810:24-386(-)
MCWERHGNETNDVPLFRLKAFEFNVTNTFCKLDRLNQSTVVKSLIMAYLFKTAMHSCIVNYSCTIIKKKSVHSLDNSTHHFFLLPIFLLLLQGCSLLEFDETKIVVAMASQARIYNFEQS